MTEFNSLILQMKKWWFGEVDTAPPSSKWQGLDLYPLELDFQILDFHCIRLLSDVKSSDVKFCVDGSDLGWVGQVGWVGRNRAQRMDKLPIVPGAIPAPGMWD